MSLTSGTRLGAYQITGLIGVGGMGEVYRASDTKLGRDVAIKTLPSELAKDPDRLARFEREAKLLAALNHAHIASVYSLDEHDGTLYLAMELVEGETLERKLARGRLPMDEALRLALQIAEALEAAHEKGVVHRDLKPANIMVSGEGRVKVLDFGLAKAFATDPKQTLVGHSPALSVAMTQQGLVLGTAGYMSPEQASGQATDQRADIWAFGVVLYELLTGKPVFTGESVPHILADVLKTEPDWSRLPKNLHPRLKLLLERCLEKKVRNRYHSIADVRVDIEKVLAGPSVETVESPVGPARQKASLIWVGGALTLAAVAAAATWFLRPSVVAKPAPVVRFSVTLPAGSWNSPNAILSISPDGTRVAYARDQVYVRNLDEVEAHPVPGSAGSLGVTEPVFSPDGQWLAYVQVDNITGPYPIKRVPVNGGASVVINDGTNGFPRGMSWPTAEALLFATDKGIVRQPANGGATEMIVAAGPDERLDSPQMLPARDAVLFTRAPATVRPTSPNEKDRQIVVQSVGRDDRKVVWQGGSAPRYLRTGQLVYAQGNALFALAFDPSARAVRGGPVPMVQGLTRALGGLSDTANFAISDTGTLAVFVSPEDPNAANAARISTTVSWVDRGGREEPLPVRPDDYTMARVSPDGTKIALVIGSGLGRPEPPSIWVYDLHTQNLSLLSAEPAIRDGPVWSPDGKKLFFRVLERVTLGHVDAIDLTTGEITTVATSKPGFERPMPWALSPDEKTLTLANALSADDVDIAALSLASGEFAQLLGGPGEQNQPSFSRDGTWIALQEASAGGTAEINIRPFPAVSRTRIPIGPGSAPVFSRDGSELFYFDGHGIALAPISYEPTLHVGASRRLFESNAYMWELYGRTWDPDPSGKRFLVIRDPIGDAVTAADAPRPGPQARIDVVLNWTEELNRRLQGEMH